jgi:hypothetical protein
MITGAANTPPRRQTMHADVRKALEMAAEALWDAEGIEIDFNSSLLADERQEYRDGAKKIMLAAMRSLSDDWTPSLIAAELAKEGGDVPKST